MRHRKIFFVIGLIALTLTLLVQCRSGTSVIKDPRGSLYAGEQTCITCHKDIVQQHRQSFHFKTSSTVNADSLEQFIGNHINAVYFSDSSNVMVAEKQGTFFQNWLQNNRTIRSEKMDFAIGSGEKAQTYAYWNHDQLFQLPLTFFTSLKSWTNSPGYPAQKPYFDRVVLSRCLECHASYVKKTDFQTGPLATSEKLDQGSIVMGIDCERCHGPSAEHVQFHQDNPSEKKAAKIVAIHSLTRQQKLDLCASCHSGNDLDVQRSLFAFSPGDTLTNFYYPYFGSGAKEPDVHGKQMQLLQTSKCFQQSDMTCQSCHSNHDQQTAQPFYISKCMDCHTSSTHAVQLFAEKKDCISCHMPVQVSKTLIFNDGTTTKRIPYPLRTHHIAVYPASESAKKP